MRTFLLTLPAVVVVACSTSSASSPASADASPDAEIDASNGGPSDVPIDAPCAAATSLDARCCSGTSFLYAACPRDFGSFGALCGDERAKLRLNATPCAGMVFAAATGVATAFVFAFDATSGTLRAVLYGGAQMQCEAADDARLVIPAACISGARFPFNDDRCNTGSLAKSDSFVPFCTTRPEGEPACKEDSSCGYPLACSAGRCAPITARDAGQEAGPDAGQDTGASGDATSSD